MTEQPIYRYVGHSWDGEGWSALLCADGGKPIAPGDGDIRRWLDKEASPEQRAEFEKALAGSPGRPPTPAERRKGARVFEPVEGDADADG